MHLIYKITNITNSKVYIGQTERTLRTRFTKHCMKNGCIKIYRAIKKYGSKNFNIQLITIAHTKKVADYWESYFIKKYNSTETGYNICLGGSILKFTKETRQKMSKSAMGKHKQISSEKEKQLVDMYLSGLSYREIKSQLNCANGTITRIIKNKNLPVRAAGRRRKS